MLRQGQQQPALNVRRALAEGFRALGLNLSLVQTDLLYAHYSLLLTWNTKTNLTSLKDPLLIVRRHFLDSAAIVRFLPTVGRLLDVGTGAGFPGLPVKVLLPDKEVFLVESQRKKANFLREVIRQLKLQKAAVIQERLEKIRLKDSGRFDEIVTRAYGSLEVFLKLSFALLQPGGRSIVMHGPKGREIFPALEDRAGEIGFAQSRMETYLLPLGNEKRTVLIFSKD